MGNPEAGTGPAGAGAAGNGRTTAVGGTAGGNGPAYGTRPQDKGPGAPSGARAVDAALAPALGWFSLALGIPQVLAPRGMVRLVGLEDTAANRTIMRAVGLRELAAGVGILTSTGAEDRPGGWLKARVAGDAMDLALLGAASTADGSDKRRLGRATMAVAGVTALDMLASARLGGEPVPQAIHARAAVTIRRPVDEVWAAWRRFEDFPAFMAHVESVTDLGGGRSHWAARGPAGTRVEWDAEITDEEPGRLIAWRSLEDADVPNSGRVELTSAPAEQGTEVRVHLVYEPPAGAFGAAVARLLGEEPNVQVRDDLRRFKQVLESGEVMRSDANPTGSAQRRQFPQRPAQPLGQPLEEAEEVRV